jgi:hypothetical protein
VRPIARLVLGALLAAGSMAIGTRPVRAECTFVPPLPKLSFAVPTATELFVGDVVANGPEGGVAFTVRVSEVLRGDAAVGEVRSYRYVEPNWPWSNGGAKPFPSCATLHATVGERVVLALGARWPGGSVRDGDLEWFQPPTTFNTIGILEGSSREQYGSGGRQLFSIERLREMVGLDPPETDTVRQPAAAAAAPPQGPAPILLLSAAIGLVVSLDRTRGRRDRRRLDQAIVRLAEHGPRPWTSPEDGLPER